MSGSGRAKQIAVIGSGRCEHDSELAQLAEQVGEGVARTGAVLVCGGLGGVMEAASRGAAEAGGEVLGIVPGTSIAEANPHCSRVVASGIGHGRNLAVVASGEVVIAVGGEWGTLSEIGFARAIGRTVVALRSWTLKGEGAMESAPGVVSVATADEAVRAALHAIEAVRAARDPIEAEPPPG